MTDIIKHTSDLPTLVDDVNQALEQLFTWVNDSLGELREKVSCGFETAFEKAEWMHDRLNESLESLKELRETQTNMLNRLERCELPCGTVFKKVETTILRGGQARIVTSLRKMAGVPFEVVEDELI